MFYGAWRGWMFVVGGCGRPVYDDMNTALGVL